jgi:electron transfer flavoprotein alpha subunit
MSAPVESCRTWVIDHCVDAATYERLGDARQFADARSESVGALIVGSCCDPGELIAAGADCVKIVESVGSAVPVSASGSEGPVSTSGSADPRSVSRSVARVARCGPRGRTAKADAILAAFRPRVVLASGSPDGREWAARLAVRRGWRLCSPALEACIDRDGRVAVTALSACGRYSRKTTLGPDETAVLTFKPGVAEAMVPDPDRTGTVECIGSLECSEEPIRVEREIPADPSEVDIRHADRIVAGGRGLGGADGFELLARVASVLKAAVAASRVAVDLGWIDRERQVGQTGKTIAPALYLACGISGASHHLAGIAEARHIVAINTDPNAPIFKAAHLALVADLHEVLSQLEAQLAAAPRSAG